MAYSDVVFCFITVTQVLHNSEMEQLYATMSDVTNLNCKISKSMCCTWLFLKLNPVYKQHSNSISPKATFRNSHHLVITTNCLKKKGNKLVINRKATHKSTT